MQTVEWLDSKTTSEIVAVSFDFKDVISSVDAVESVTVSVIDGNDPLFSNMLFNSASLTGSVVTQLIRNGVDNCTYLITANVIKGNERYSLAGYLPVKAYK